jgi:hypothetical protein
VAVYLKDHPLMLYHGVPNWPPVWVKGSTQRDRHIIRGDVGILKYVHFYGPISNKCFLVIEHAGEHFVGTLMFDDLAFCRQIADILRDCIGHSIKEIGELDLSHTL